MPHDDWRIQDARRILIIKPSSLGDVVHALPVLAALRDAVPQAHIAWMAAKAFAPLLDGCPLLDEVILFDRRNYGAIHRRFDALRDFVRFLRDLRGRRFDLVVDLQGLYRSGFFALVSGAPRRIGFARTREFASLHYTRRVACPPTTRHAVERNLCIASALGLTVDEPQFPLGLSALERDRAQALLTRAAGRTLDAFIAVVPGARWVTKQWPAERYAALIDRLHAEGRPPCVLLGSPDEAEVAARIRSACAAPTIDLTGQTSLRELAAVLDRADLVLCNDSGPMHIAAALDRPTVAFFGPTDPRRCGPYSSQARVVRAAVDCLGCYRRACPHVSCLEKLTVDDALAAIRELEARVLGRAPADAQT